MATLTSTPSISPSSISISGNTSKSATISWTCPTIPNDCTITSCVLTGRATASMSKGNATITVNGTTVTSGAQFSINLGTANTTTSVAVTAKGGNKNASGTVTFSNLVYTVTYEEPKVYYTVTFTDWDGTTLKTQTVEEGSSATAPSNPTREGYTFTGWDVNYSNITSNLTVTAQYTIATYTVTFVDWDGTVLKTENVEHGSSATAPSNPTRDDYIFIGWDKDYINVKSNLTIAALYEIDPDSITNIFPAFTSEGWILDSVVTSTMVEDYAYGFTTDDVSGWKGVYISVPDEWYGNAIKLNVESITDNASLVVQRADTYEEICVINPTNTEAIARIIPDIPYTIFLRTNYLQSGEVLVTGVTADYEYELVNIETLNLNINELEIANGKTDTVKCEVTPSDAVYNLIWSLDSSIVSFGYNGLHCNLLALELGTCTLTVTDSITGLSDSCVITIVEGNSANANVFPPFNVPNTWLLEPSCTLLDMQSYDCSFQTPATWCGISISVPDSWYGNTVELKCESISDNAGLYIQEADTWVELGILNSTSTTIQIEFPSKGTYSDIKIALQAPLTTGTISISGVEATIIGFGDNEDEDVTYLTFDNRIVGYKKPENEPVVANAVICQNVDEVTSALSNATAGTTIYLKQGIYTFPNNLEIGVKGTADNYITIKGYPEETVIISGSTVTLLANAKYVNFENITITNLSDLHWTHAMKVAGGASYINIRNVEIYNINCREIVGEETSGCNPLLIYGDASEVTSNINIENCYIHDCDTGWSEALTLNGNVENCTIKNCTINNITNIGIDLAGNYEWTGTVGDPNNQTRHCIVENCLVMNCQSPYATSAGLYSDGSRDNTFRYNVIYNCQCGIELGSEQPGSVSENFIINNNLIIDSGRCIGVGAYLETGAPNRNAYIYNNTFICGDNNKENYGLYVERTDNVNFYNNIVYGTANTKLFSNSYNSTVNMGNNCWYQPSGSKPAADTTGIFAEPLFVNNTLTVDGDYQLLENSLCINGGVNTDVDYVGDTDLNGNTRKINIIIDIGAFEKIGITSNLRVKENGSWVTIKNIYKKVSGTWVLQESVSESFFDSNTKYIRKN